MSAIKVFGTHDDNTIKQLMTCVEAEPDARGVLCADGHLGYSMPIGGVVAYRDHISPSGVGYDIGCGNYAVKTNIRYADVEPDAERIATEIQRRISFGVGRVNDERVDLSLPIFDRIARSPVLEQVSWLQLATNQFGTVGSGNHYVDVLIDLDGWLWVACHFGSRGFGHKTASMFMNLAQGMPALEKSHDGEMMSPPLLIPTATELGQDYIEAMTIAGEYAYAGRDYVVKKVVSMLGAQIVDEVHNHHNFAWAEKHFGNKYWVVRKGATPAFPGQRGFIGGSMGDICVIVSGKLTELAEVGLFSTVHGAGRVLSRTAAIKGKHEWRCVNGCQTNAQLSSVPGAWPPKDLKCPLHRTPLEKFQIQAPVDFQAVQEKMKERGVILRGAGPDEAPQVYRSLPDVLNAHVGTIDVETYMLPRIVVMAGKEVKDPYKD